MARTKSRPTDNFHCCYGVDVVRPIGRLNRRNPLAVPKKFERISQLALPYEWPDSAKKIASGYNKKAAKLGWSTWAVISPDAQLYDLDEQLERTTEAFRPGKGKWEEEPRLRFHARRACLYPGMEDMRLRLHTSLDFTEHFDADKALGLDWNKYVVAVVSKSLRHLRQRLREMEQRRAKQPKRLKVHRAIA